ncbi:helix-turn-helix domain-containing protein [Dehalobacter sp. TeCB1]|uniref:helix-turn-helix transcriptional regulator n=1 Tax=Dehalobacter sp. TeCB1 TaxID=1843715 RepID=UPI001FA7B8BF|nr:helix-turn-helix domain-containing protein [Dehalobacter sp. TeCB1]
MVKNRLREIRHELMIDSQTEMAMILDISQQQYNSYERQEKQPSLETALKIAKKLNRSVESIFLLKK